MAFIEWLNRGTLPREQVGGKGASLSHLSSGGFDVPPGFAVTAEGYARFAEAADLSFLLSQVAGDLGETGVLRKLAEEIEAAILATELPADLRDAIAAGYAELVAAVGPACAVRSSAVAEDDAAASFAGLYETYLNIRGEAAVLDAVRRCYASLWSERAIHYRTVQRGLDVAEAMPVVVMSLVPAETSGVAFTVHPVTGERDKVVINASFGLGEAIVSGRVTPDSFVVQKESLKIVERGIYAKTFAIYPHPEEPRTVEEDLPPDKASAPSLLDDQARAVASLAAKAEVYYGVPQDIEWALANERIYLLQSRPVTTLF